MADMPAKIWAYTGEISAFITEQPRSASEFFQEYRRADLVEQMAAALRAAQLALSEAEAILGGEYGDHYAVLCDRVLDLTNKARAALQAYDAAQPAKQAEAR